MSDHFSILELLFLFAKLMCEKCYFILVLKCIFLFNSEVKQSFYKFAHFTFQVYFYCSKEAVCLISISH
jgi:hypothetical protein